MKKRLLRILLPVFACAVILTPAAFHNSDEHQSVDDALANNIIVRNITIEDDDDEQQDSKDGREQNVNWGS